MLGIDFSLTHALHHGREARTGERLDRQEHVGRSRIGAFLGHPLHLERDCVQVAQHAARLRPHRKPQCSICAELNVVQARDGFRHGRTRHEKRTQKAADEERFAGREFRPAAAEVREGVHVVDAHNGSRVVGCWPSYVFLSSVWHEATNRIPGIHHEHELMALQDLGSDLEAISKIRVRLDKDYGSFQQFTHLVTQPE